jgi:hypothetical protein
MIFPVPSPIEYIKAFGLALIVGLVLGLAVADRWGNP